MRRLWSSYEEGAFATSKEAGASEEGRELSARAGEVIFSFAPDLSAALAFADDRLRCQPIGPLLARLARTFGGQDFSGYPLDAPFPTDIDRGHLGLRVPENAHAPASASLSR